MFNILKIFVFFLKYMNIYLVHSDIIFDLILFYVIYCLFFLMHSFFFIVLIIIDFFDRMLGKNF